MGTRLRGRAGLGKSALHAGGRPFPDKAKAGRPTGGRLLSPPMSKSAKSGAAGDSGELSFSDALGKLERVVEAMESEDLPLEALLARYEEGMKLVRLCEARLAAAEVRIRQLEQEPEADAPPAPADPQPSAQG